MSALKDFLQPLNLFGSFRDKGLRTASGAVNKTGSTKKKKQPWTRHMHDKIIRDASTFVPEHVQPAASAPTDLKTAIDAANLTEMWDMILTLDYGVSTPEDLPRDKSDEFLNVMSLLLKAFER